MKIDFYEEFPTKRNLKKLKLINFPCRIFIAAHSTKEFEISENEVKKINNGILCCYWPIIKNSYWISPFSNTRDLKQKFEELEKCKKPLLIDLELPLRKVMIFKNLFNFGKNKKIIRKFLEKNKKRVTTAQFPKSTTSASARFLGLDYAARLEKSPMCYSSLAPKLFRQFVRNKTEKSLRELKNKNHYSIGLGIIASGIKEHNNILSPKNLEEDLAFVKEAGYKRAIIYRSGGLNKHYIRVLRKFI